MDRSILAVQWHARQTPRRDRAGHCALSPFFRAWLGYMVKTNPLGALAATAGTLVAVGLLMLMLLVVEVRPAEAAGEVGGFNVTNNTTNDHSPSYSPSGEKIAYRVARSDGLHSDIYTINVGGGGRFNVTDDRKNERDPSYSPDGTKIAY
jgi:WD40-like Beta Propeller Repeat